MQNSVIRVPPCPLPSHCWLRCTTGRCSIEVCAGCGHFCCYLYMDPFVLGSTIPAAVSLSMMCAAPTLSWLTQRQQAAIRSGFAAERLMSMPHIAAKQSRLGFFCPDYTDISCSAPTAYRRQMMFHQTDSHIHRVRTGGHGAPAAVRLPARRRRCKSRRDGRPRKAEDGGRHRNRRRAAVRLAQPPGAARDSGGGGASGNFDRVEPRAQVSLRGFRSALQASKP